MRLRDPRTSRVDLSTFKEDAPEVEQLEAAKEACVGRRGAGSSLIIFIISLFYYL